MIIVMRICFFGYGKATFNDTKIVAERISDNLSNKVTSIGGKIYVIRTSFPLQLLIFVGLQAFYSGRTKSGTFV